MELEISLAPEVLFHVFGFPVTNSFIWMMVVSVFLMVFAVIIGRGVKIVPGRVQNLAETIFEGWWNFCRSIIPEEEKAKKAFTLSFTFFIFILLSNLMTFLPGQGAYSIHTEEGFMPGFRAVMADYGLVLVMTLITVVSVQVFGIIYCGPFNYLGKFINFKNPLAFFIGLIELVGEFSRILSLSFRLFGNIFAGEVLAMVMLFLAPFFVPLPFLALEIISSVIQAFVFATLTLVFINMASSLEGHEEEH